VEVLGLHSSPVVSHSLHSGLLTNRKAHNSCAVVPSGVRCPGVTQVVGGVGQT